MNGLLFALGAVGAVVFLLLLVVACLPSPTVTLLLKRLRRR